MYTYFLRNRNVEGIIVYFCREATILGNIRWLEGRRNLLFVRVRLLEKVSVELSRIVRIVDNRRIERLFVPWRITNACSHRSLFLSLPSSLILQIRDRNSRRKQGVNCETR